MAAPLEDLTTNASVRGILPDRLVTVVSVQWFGSEALELTYKDPTERVANQLLYRHDEPRLELVEIGRPWSFDGDGALFRLVCEAHRIRLAHFFDPVLAVPGVSFIDEGGAAAKLSNAIAIFEIVVRSLILAIVEFVDADEHRIHYVRRPFTREPDIRVTSVNYDLKELISRAQQAS
jgi:hypothetical protein